MSAGVVDILTSKNLPIGVKKLSDILKSAICAGVCHPFSEPLIAQNDVKIHCNEGSVLSLEQIIGMDWLADNVVGSIPVYEELSQEGKATVDMVGIEKVKNEKKDKLEQV